MVFEDSSSSTSMSSRYLGEGFRNEPDFRDGVATYEVVTETGPTTTAAAPSAIPTARRAAKPNLEYVFDDPAHGEPGRDRLLVHVIWELLLAVAVAGLGFLLYHADSQALSGGGLRAVALSAATIGLVAAAVAMSLRAGVPNLAAGAVAVAAALYFARHYSGGTLQPLLIALGLAAAVGLVQGIVVVLLQVPAWAASLAVAAGLVVWIGTGGPVSLTRAAYDPTPHAYFWFGGFAGLSVLAGLAGLIPPLRRAVGRFRPVADPAERRGAVAGLFAVGATVISSLLAATGGLLAVWSSRQVPVGDGIQLTALAVGVALLGGTSAFGRRGGIFGTVLAATLVTVAIGYTQAIGHPWTTFALGAVAIGLGLGVTRVVERFGRPDGGADEDDEEEWSPRVHAANNTGTGTGTGAARSWQPTATPATPAVGGLWASDDAWGAQR
jgi:ribose/xylose/arabinose/galactoside ABC-type transport system permease subunit